MPTHSERLARFEEAIYKQKEEMEEKMAEMMNLLEEYTKVKNSKEGISKRKRQHPNVKVVNSISIDHAINNEKEKTPNSTQTVEEPPTSQPLGYYLKHDINKETITN